ncbi:hypothetical protein WA026_019657 [Henosepilachna vigintioctopunctata]|uniref:Uncharacterized protein n=1 Tax=Henosepilachna vigintioctopunctata TaxID=420089 RepID=A0AAW1TYD1_9CUCU
MVKYIPQFHPQNYMGKNYSLSSEEIEILKENITSQEESEKRVSILTCELQEMSRLIEEKDKYKETLESKIVDLQRKVEKMEELYKKISEYDSLINENAKLRNHADKMEQINKKLQNTSNKNKYQELQKKYETIINENERLISANEFMEKQLESYEEKMHAKGENYCSIEQLQSANNEIKMLRLELNKLQTEQTHEIPSDIQNAGQGHESLYGILKKEMDLNFRRLEENLNREVFNLRNELNLPRKPLYAQIIKQKYKYSSSVKPNLAIADTLSEQNLLMDDIINLGKEPRTLESKSVNLPDKHIQTVNESQTKQNMQENQGLNSEKQPLVQKLKAANQFHPKRKQNSIIGTGNANKINIKGVRQFGHLHVCKLDPNIGEAEVNEYLNENGFDDVRCVKLDSRRPDEHSSFRISVPKDKIDSLRNPEI